MALFGKKTKDSGVESAKKTAKLAKTVSKALSTDHNLDGVILNPRLSEKTVVLGDKNVYTFLVHSNATKYQVRDAIKALYHVTPERINIVNKQPAKRLKGSRGNMVHVPGMKKAYVYLAKGDSINIV